MRANEALKKLLREDGRKAVLRVELLKRSTASPSSCDRALKRSCDDGSLVRVGHGVYAIGNAKVFEVVPEVMPKLGYEILPVQRVRGYSQKTSGRTWRLDRPTKRQIRKRGVYAVFEDKEGNPCNIKEREKRMDLPSTRDIEDRFHTFAQCHSLARAEKDLIVERALDALEQFHDERATLAIEGGTALAYYYRMINRFSEDLDIRIVLRPEVASLDTIERTEQVKDIGVKFQKHIQESLPFLQFTSKGRVRADGIMQSQIFDYRSQVPHVDVVAGVKIELATIPLETRFKLVMRRKNHELPTVNFVEIAAGKWQALASRLPDRSDSNPDLVRHVHDLAALSAAIESASTQFRKMALKGPVHNESISSVLDELQSHPWRGHYMDYMRRMGATAIADEPGHHPSWDVVLSGFRATARVLSSSA